MMPTKLKITFAVNNFVHQFFIAVYFIKAHTARQVRQYELDLKYFYNTVLHFMALMSVRK